MINIITDYAGYGNGGPSYSFHPEWVKSDIIPEGCYTIVTHLADGVKPNVMILETLKNILFSKVDF